ncbi:MAG: NosD domain-containing protein [Candidatus Thermoplasmatota archaeon]
MEKRLLKKGIILLCIAFIFSTVSPVGRSVHIIEQTPPRVNPTTLYVGGTGPGNYSSINDAIVAAAIGDTVFVFDDSSPYFECVVIPIRINLIGENKQTTVIDGSYTGDVVTIRSSGVNISGFTITHGTTGISVKNRMTNVTISNNIITENTGAGINFSDFCEHNILSENIITKNRNGTIFSAGSYNTIYGNTFAYNTELGLGLIMWCNENTISQNNFIRNKINSFFFLSALNTWSRNYWNRPRILPKPIFGLMIVLPWLNFDLRPLLRPYQIHE